MQATITRALAAPAAVVVTAALAVVPALGGCRKRPPESLQEGAAAAIEQRIVNAIDGRCPDALEAARAGGLQPGRYQVPGDSERKELREAVAILVAGGPDALSRATHHARAAAFEVVELAEQGAVLLRDAANKRGGGAYMIRPGSTATIFVQAPHTFYDEGTLPLACELFGRARAGALFINTAHRYKAAAQTPGGQHPADVAHARNSFFQAATEGLLRARRSATVIQVHGFGEREGAGAIVLSAGVRAPGHPMVARVATALSRVIDGGVLRYPEDHGELGATTNVQGAIVRESGGQFLHIEMAAPLRRDLLGNPMVRASVLSTLADAMEGA